MLGPLPSSVDRALDLVRRGAGPEPEARRAAWPCGGHGTILHCDGIHPPGNEPVREPGTGRLTQHAFSFGAHYDPESVVRADGLPRRPPARTRAGFAEHPHRDLEIVTWVLSGSLVHTDSTGHARVVDPARSACCRPARGVVHARSRARAGRPVRPGLAAAGRAGHAAGVARRSRSSGPDAGLVPSRRARRTRWRIGVRRRAFRVARLAPGETVTLPGPPSARLRRLAGALLARRRRSRPATPSASVAEPPHQRVTGRRPDRAPGVVVQHLRWRWRVSGGPAVARPPTGPRGRRRRRPPAARAWSLVRVEQHQPLTWLT